MSTVRSESPDSASAESATALKSTDALLGPPSRTSVAVSDSGVGSSTANHDRHRSRSPPPVPAQAAFSRAVTLSKKLSNSNIPSRVTKSGDLMLDTTGFKSGHDEITRAEIVARKILSDEIEGDYDIGSLIGADERGNLWIYSSEEAKEAANRRAAFNSIHPAMDDDAISDPGYQSDSDRSISPPLASHHRSQSDADVDAQNGFAGPSRGLTSGSGIGDPNRNYAKTLRLTSDQLKALNLKQGANPMTFSVNKATCTAYMYLWYYKTPIVISDIDGTITKYEVHLRTIFC